jgi:hypothetical protein
MPALVAAHKDADYCTFFRQTNHWAAGDVGTSVPLSDGRVLWFFGDSFIDQFDPVTGTLPAIFDARNAVIVQQNTNAPTPSLTLAQFGETDKSFFRPPDAGNTNFWPCYWPAAGFQAGNTIYVYLAEIDKTPSGGMWGFKGIGQAMAKMSFPDLKVTGYIKLPSFNGIKFSSGFVTDDDAGYTYAFGAKAHGIGSDVYVARFPARDPESGPWRFWNGRGWSENVTNAAAIAHGASVSVSACRVNGTYLLITTAFSVACDQGRDIFVLTCKSPTGPFTPRRKIYTLGADDTVEGHYPFFYIAVPHPELMNADGLLITYCINGYLPCVPMTVNGRTNPDYYRLRAIRLLMGGMANYK